MSREIMQQALNLLKSAYVSTALIWDRADCVESLEAALAQPEQEPYFCKDCGKGLLGKEHIHTCSPQVKR